MATPIDVTLDHVASIVVPAARVGHYHNEFAVLGAWRNGLYFLYSQLRAMEKLQLHSRRIELTGEGEMPPPTSLIFNNISCCNQWYAVTLCNFVELIGCIGFELDKTKHQPPREYVKALIKPVLEYRNTAAAHVYRARPSDRHSTPASRFLSLLPSSAMMNDRFQIGMYQTTIVRSGNTTTSGTSPWQPTTLHEELAARFWPDWQPPDWLAQL